MIVTPTCRFCQGYLIPGGSMTGSMSYTKLIYNCVKCHSQQQYKYDASPLDFSFDLKFTDYWYNVSFDPVTMKLVIVKVSNENGHSDWKLCLDIHLSEIPAWLRPDKMTEHRIKTMMVFS